MMALLIKNTALCLALMIGISALSTCSQPAYALGLSKSSSVTPERHSGFFAPMLCLVSQTHQNSRAWPATATRLQSVYGGMTSQNKPFVVNMWGGSTRPRVNPATLSNAQFDRVDSQNLVGTPS